MPRARDAASDGGRAPTTARARSQGHLIEVNAHSLFSKWFSESGKMVLGMFTKIREILEVRRPSLQARAGCANPGGRCAEHAGWRLRAAALACGRPPRARARRTLA